MENNYKVYKHTTPSGKVYIGITGDSVENRWRNGKGYKNNFHFSNAIKYYGWENIKHEILFEELSKEEAEKKEIELISYYKSNNKKYGYNIENGGNSIGKHSEEVKAKIRSSNKNKKRSKEACLKMSVAKKGKKWTEAQRKALTGRKISEETKRKMSEARKGRIVSEATRKKLSEANKGKKLSIETKEKLRLASLGKKMTAENKEKIKEAVCKKIIQIKDDKIINEWESIREASRTLNICNSSITECCRGKRKTAGGFSWRYANEIL